MLEVAAPKIAKVFSSWKNFKTASKVVGSQTLREQLVNGRRTRKGAIMGNELAYGRKAGKVIRTKSTKQNSRSRRGIIQAFLDDQVRQFLVPTFCGSSSESGRESPTSWLSLVVLQAGNLCFYFIGWKLQRVCISNRLELLRWFETVVVGSEAELCQRPFLRNLQYRKS